MPPAKNPSLRRELILAVLRGEISQGEAERRLGMAQGSMSRAVAGVRRDPEGALREAEEEAAFRREVAALVGE